MIPILLLAYSGILLISGAQFYLSRKNFNKADWFATVSLSLATMVVTTFIVVHVPSPIPYWISVFKPITEGLYHLMGN